MCDVIWQDNIKKYGVVDTKDGVVEYYRKEELLQATRKLGSVICGVVHTGSDLVIRLQTETTAMLSTLHPKNTFLGYWKGKELVFMYIGRGSLDEFLLFDGKAMIKLSVEYLRNHADLFKFIKLVENKEIVEQFRVTYPNHRLNFY